MHIEYLADLLLQLVDHHQTVLMEDVHEGFEDVHVESWGDQFPVRTPFIARTDQQTLTQPGFEEAILIRLVNVHMGVQYDLGIIGMSQKNEHFVTQKASRNIAVLLTPFHALAENILKWTWK